ncbi:sulfite exporter TauE/SafE family protein [Algoriphagus machipongonensis]|uniref:Membrane protein n=1 Tax=Algoriphagus machipongonensis TaxID=388413 RepID=A3HZP5_9BACT|nr:sulfite exporter TauE/SafE family protein [Algoriphagus machipongonensis]EAZ80731.1 membrane protein [Algoriphagus machipongonensis]
MLWTAIVLGFLGSFHCVGMCGPIALAVGGSNKNTFLLKKMIYHFGRSLTYALLGLIVGSLGFSLALAGIQQGLSIAMGVAIVILAISFKKSDLLMEKSFFSNFILWIKRKLGFYIKSGKTSAYLTTGMINGLLPCGMVYMALVAALGMQNPWTGAAYMFFFGLGTIPLLLILMFSGSLFSIQTRVKLQSLIPYLGVLIGVLFIFRGLGLGGFGLSPEIQLYEYGTQQVEITVCR